jgi:hypothetical protein
MDSWCCEFPDERLTYGRLIEFANGLPIPSMILSLHRCLLIAIAFAAAVCAANAAPRVHVVGGEQVDLGRGRPGRFVRDLAITNSGSDTLVIIAIGSGCGCLVGEPDRRELGPGDTARVQLTIETSGQVAEAWSKALTITTNDPVRPVVDVTVRVSFRHDVRLRSLINTVHREPCDGDCAWTIELENIGEMPLTVQPPLAEEMRGLDVRFDVHEPRVLAPGETLRVTARVAVLGGEEFPSARVLLTTSSQLDSELHVMWFYAPETK